MIVMSGKYVCMYIEVNTAMLVVYPLLMLGSGVSFAAATHLLHVYIGLLCFTKS
jgi:membrane protein required for beta-lactamase induction